MSSFPENKFVEFPQATPPTVDISTVVVDVRQWSNKGYDFIAGAGLGFTGSLEGSVSGRNWTSIVALGASSQGSISDHYNLVRVNVTVAGALGSGTELVISGKVL